MSSETFEEQQFDKTDHAQKPFARGVYIDCIFNQCDFSKAILNNYEFVDCTFNHCNLSLAVTDNTRLKGVTFNDCKLTGLDFSLCDDFMFAISLNRCIADYCNFIRKKLKKVQFTDCSLKEADFTDADLGAAHFKNCDLERTTFKNTNLEKADFTTAINYSFDPDQNIIKKARFSVAGLGGLLGKYSIQVIP